MELKYLSSEHMSMRKVSFNRTFMELKYEVNNISEAVTKVLIVPLWNWNKFLGAGTKQVLRFNRTFMELKSIIHHDGFIRSKKF